MMDTHIIVSRSKPGTPYNPTEPEILYFAGPEFSAPPDLAAATWSAESRSAWSADRAKATRLARKVAERLRDFDLQTTDRILSIELA
jgi:hypothetical protein